MMVLTVERPDTQSYKVYLGATQLELCQALSAEIRVIRVVV